MKKCIAINSSLIGMIAPVVLALGLVGWFANLYKLANCDFEAPYKAEVIHSIGIVPVVGAVTGYMDLGK